jgi:hypothetical protein
MYISYIPKRSTFEDSNGGELQVGVQPYMPSHKSEGSQQTSLNGTPHGTLFYIEKEHVITTVPVNISNPNTLKQWEEFHHSVIASEVFVFDLEGAIGSSVDPKNVYLKKGTFTASYVGPLHRQFTFTIVEIDA